MLQQTRVAAVIPYYERFLTRFPNPQALAEARGEDVLTLWSGLGYYSRARNLQKASRQMMERGGFPQTHEEILELPGVGAYTAAAVASIAFGLPHAVVDGNVRRVAMRLMNDGTADVQAVADVLLDKTNPSRSNQALMELGATVCTPRDPQCLLCPVNRYCLALNAGTVAELPPPKRKDAPIRKERRLWVIERKRKILLTPSPRVNGFWELPETREAADTSMGLIEVGEKLGAFRHAITNSQYSFEVYRATVTGTPTGCKWFAIGELEKIPLSTASKKALRCLREQDLKRG
jgi:A/G-specific adenine glycosylase